MLVFRTLRARSFEINLNKNNWNNASKRLFGSYSSLEYMDFHWEQNSRNIFRDIFLFRNIPNERALNGLLGCKISCMQDQKLEFLNPY